MKPKPISRLQANFFTGLAVVLPAIISIAVVVWLFGTVANITDNQSWHGHAGLHHRAGAGPAHGG